jgi:hypothetical protein
MTFTEPMTMITDYLITVVAAIAVVKLLKDSPRGRSVRFWAAALAFTGLAAATGGTYHGFQAIMSPSLLSAVWKATMVAIGLASFCFAVAVILAAFAGAPRKICLAVVIVQLVTYLLWLIAHDDYRYAIYDYVPTMIGVLIIQLYVWRSRREPGAPWIIAGILISFAAAIIQMSGRGIHRHFNHADLYHVVQMVGVYCFYRGGRWLADREPGPR